MSAATVTIDGGTFRRDPDGVWRHAGGHWFTPTLAQLYDALAAAEACAADLNAERLRLLAGLTGIVDACAAACESRARSYHGDHSQPDWLTRALEAGKCGMAAQSRGLDAVWRLCHPDAKPVNVFGVPEHAACADAERRAAQPCLACEARVGGTPA